MRKKMEQHRNTGNCSKDIHNTRCTMHNGCMHPYYKSYNEDTCCIILNVIYCNEIVLSHYFCGSVVGALLHCRVQRYYF